MGPLERRGRRGDDILSDSVRSIFDAGLVDLVATDHKICDEVWLESTPGHTPGHVSVRISSNGEDALITGDCMHHPCQMAMSDMCSNADSDPDMARATRHTLLNKYVDGPVLVIGTHFATPTAGYIVRDGDAFRLAV